jgi:hypothetical protein
MLDAPIALAQIEEGTVDQLTGWRVLRRDAWE